MIRVRIYAGVKKFSKRFVLVDEKKVKKKKKNLKEEKKIRGICVSVKKRKDGMLYIDDV